MKTNHLQFTGMKRSLLTSILLICMLVYAPLFSQTVHFDDPTFQDKATSITGLMVNGTAYDVSFEEGTPVNIYGPFPGAFTFDSIISLDALNAINVALNANDALFVGAVGSIEFPQYWIGYDSDMLSALEQCIMRKGKYTVSTFSWDSFGIGQTNYNIDPYLWATFSIATSIEDFEQENASEKYALNNYPNPVRSTTTIEYVLSEHAEVVLKVLDSNGKLISILVNEHQDSGVQKVFWNTQKYEGNNVPSGVYICQLNVDGNSISKTMIIQ